MAEEAKEQRAGIFSLKNIFFVIIILSIAQPLFLNLKKQIMETIHPNTYVGCIKVKEVIYDSNFYTKNINKFLKDPNIKALLLKVNCRGGLPGASQSIFNELKKFKTTKPIVAMVEDFSASGGYYISAAADKIISTPSAMIGSIGVVMQMPNVKAFINNYKLDMQLLQAGKFKTSTSPFKDKTPEEIAHLNEILMESYDQFVNDMASIRGLDPNNRSAWADGKIFTGNQALKLNLIDGIGSISDAREAIKEVMQARDMEVVGKIKLVYPKRLSGLSRVFYGDIDENNESGFAMKIASMINSVYKNLVTLSFFDQPKRN